MKKIYIVALACFSMSLNANSIDSMIEKTNDANSNSKKSQKTIDSYSDTSEKIYDEYITSKKELEEQITYNRQLELILKTQKQEIPKLEKQLTEIETTNRKIIPLMFDMIEKLEKFVSVDTIFLKEERTQRVESLKNYLSNPDMNTAQQFRTILESYKIEYGYSRTLEVYRSELKIGESEGKTVDFLRVGRLALYYQSLDFTESGYYDLQAGKWIILDDDYNELIKNGIKMARKKISPDFLTLPIKSVKAEK